MVGIYGIESHDFFFTLDGHQGSDNESGLFSVFFSLVGSLCDNGRIFRYLHECFLTRCQPWYLPKPEPELCARSTRRPKQGAGACLPSPCSEPGLSLASGVRKTGPDNQVSVGSL